MLFYFHAARYAAFIFDLKQSLRRRAEGIYYIDGYLALWRVILYRACLLYFHLRGDAYHFHGVMLNIFICHMHQYIIIAALPERVCECAAAGRIFVSSLRYLLITIWLAERQ